MSWPVKIILSCEGVLEIKWKKWALSFLCISFLVLISGVIVRAIAPAAWSNILKESPLLLLMLSLAFFIIVAIRVYYYGMCLSVYEAYEYESAITKKEWTEWASQEVFVPAYKLFTPSGISQADIASAKSVEIFKGQQVKLRGHDGEAYTEGQLFDELLASVRAKVMDLAKTCVFDIIFTYGSSDITLRTFKECWIAVGFPEECLNKYSSLIGTVEQEFDALSNTQKKCVSIVISANVEHVENYSAELTEFASILLFTPQKDLSGNTNNGVALRAMECDKALARQNFIHMMTYQPEVLQTKKLLLSNMSADEAINILDILRVSCQSINIDWEYEAQHLNLVLGQLGGEHFWMAFPLALFMSEKSRESVLMITNIGNTYVFNVIKPFDNSREQ